MSSGGLPDLASESSSRFGLRHILAQAGWAGGFEIGGIGVRYLLVLLIARLYGAAGLGLYTLAIAFASGAALMGRVGLDRAALRFTAHYRAQDQATGVVGVNAFASVVTLALSSLIAVLLVLASDPIAAIWKQPGLSEALRIVAIAVPAIALGEVWRDGLRGFQDIRFAALLEKVVIPGASASLVLVLFLVRPSEVLEPIIAAVVSYWLAAVAAGIVLRRSIRRLAARPRLEPRPWLTFAIFLSMEGGLLYILQWTDQLLVGLFLSASDVGIYAAAVRVGSLAAVPLLAVNTILAPTIAGLSARGDRARLKETYSRLIWITAIAGLTIGVAVIAAGIPILSLFGPEFTAGYGALVIVTIGHIVNAGTGSSGVMLGMTGHVRWRLANAAMAAVLNATLNWLLIPAWGILGSATATAVSIIVINLLQILEVRFVLGFWGYDPRGLAFWVEVLRRRGWSRSVLG